jgi:TRAP-type C4-dicarboxylate transport system substrate-binding protein
MRALVLAVAGAGLLASPAIAQIQGKVASPVTATSRPAPAPAPQPVTAPTWDQLTPEQQIAVREYVAREERKADKRTPRQKCIDEEIAASGGTVTHLESGAIDLKCSQR